MILKNAWVLGGATGSVAIASVVTGVLLTASSSPSTNVLGEKVTGSGSSNVSPLAAGGNGNGNNGNGNGNGGSSGNNSPGKAFTISGSVQGLFPGATTKLFLTVNNPNNQAMTVTALSATLTSVSGASGCAATASNLTISPYTGGTFDVAANGSAVSVGYIPLTLPSSVANACQDAMYNLTYSGTAVQK